MQELHDGLVRGHFRGNTTAHKILHVGYYWPTLFKDAHDYARKCKTCQTAVGREKKPTFALQPVNIQEPFEQWGLDINVRLFLTLASNTSTSLQLLIISPSG